MDELKEQIRNSKAVEALIKYLNDNNLVNDLVNHIFIITKNGNITNKINYYKDINNRLYNLYEIENNNLNKDDMEKSSVLSI